MKKSLLALAALSAFATAAQAQSSVTIYGNLDIGASQMTQEALTAGSAATKRTVNSTGNGDGDLSTSTLGFMGTEDLGGGVKAGFKVELDLVNFGGSNVGGQDATAFNNTRHSYVSLSSASAGELRLGRDTTAIHGVIVGNSAGGGNNIIGALYSSGGGATKGTTGYLYNRTALLSDSTLTMRQAESTALSARPHEAFVSNAITYISPSFGGLNAVAQYASQSASKQAAASAGWKEKGLSVNYVAGKLSLNAGMEDITAEGSSTGIKAKATAYGANYDFGIVKAYALHTRRTDTNMLSGTDNNQEKTTEIGLRAPVTKAVTVFASTFSGKRDVGANATATTGLINSYDTKGTQVGAIYALSKRTSAYLVSGQQEVVGTNSGAGVGTGQEGKATTVGVRHSF